MTHLLRHLALALALVTAGCASLPPPSDRSDTTARVDTADTRLGRSGAPLTSAHPGLSGIHKLPEPHDAFAARVLLAGAAERSIDAQYFIWNGDQVGYLMWQALWKAAERGVRVRLLLDDANTSGNDATIAALDAHPNIEVRLYNPFAQRKSRGLAYLTDFGRLNRRMHNKSFTVDNQMAVVGGRNIANEYFGAGEGIGFADIDVVAVGPVVQDVSREFDLFWNSASAYPAAGFVGPAAPDAAEQLLARFAQTEVDPISRAYLDAVREATLMDDLRNHSLRIEWTTAKVVHDDPAKTLDREARTDVLLLPVLIQSLGRPEKSLDIVSPYFVPGDEGTAALSDLARRGVRVRILTNSLAASDEAVVHAGYMKRRRDLLRAGVELWELKPTATEESLKVKGRFGAAKVAGLHAKTYAVDRRRIFIGSFNFDQRSARLNTEMGMVIESEQFAGDLARTFDDEVRQIAYRVRLTPDGNELQWIEDKSAGQEVRHDSDPETSAAKRMGVGMLAILPIEWLL
ncbi:phospholipase D family protein [Variovorax ureilyticus]|uniref:Phospholipase D family protein n=1 Tax=Variovorax ureilyticus TaxID=1836198 RepID=A0ABU8VMS2_9BURK